MRGRTTTRRSSFDARGRRRIRSGVALAVAVVAVLAAIGGTAGAARTGGDVVVERPALAGPPTPGSGMGTQAALDDARCRQEDSSGQPIAEGYGRWDNSVRGAGPVCVQPWAGGDNGGATTPGVTKDAIVVVGVLPNAQQLSVTSQAAGSTAIQRSTNTPGGSYADAVHDYLLAVMPMYETWGRDIEVKLLTSSGDDEASQRADAVKVKAMKPFAMLDFNVTGLDILERDVAQAKIMVFGNATTLAKASAQAPYRWGLSDTQAAAINTAEIVGKQLVGKKAEFGGDDVSGERRTFGAVYQTALTDADLLAKALDGYGAKLAVSAPYSGNGGPVGDPTTAQEQAPTIVAKMKSAGVTTVLLFAEREMVNALMEQATSQGWFPEWYLTGSLYQDLTLFARSYDQGQAAHMFGVGSLSPYIKPDSNQVGLTNAQQADPLNWYWGFQGPGTAVSSAVPVPVNWLMTGIHTAGPKLTPTTFRQGLFAIPATGGAASNPQTGYLSGYGRTPGLPYPEYMAGPGLDFAPLWWAPDTTGLGNALGNEGKGVMQYLDGAKRYRAGQWPKQKFAWFDADASIITLDAASQPKLVAADPCQDCPASGATTPTAGVDGDTFVVKAGGGEQT